MSMEDGKLFSSAGDQLPLPTFPEACGPARSAITSALIHINRTEYFVDDDHPDAQEQEDQLSEALDAAQAAFDNKPEGCKMVRRGDDGFECEDCGWSAEIPGDL